MKGRTSCPKCKHEFVLDLPADGKKHDITCPKCNHNFSITAKPVEECDSDECSWEEHGEPRKTILSSFKPKTKKPRIATIFLIIVFIIGLSTAVFSEIFIETSLDAASNLGFDAKAQITVYNDSNQTLSNISISLDGINEKTNDNGTIKLDCIKPGIYNLEILSKDHKLHREEIIIMPFFDTKNDYVLKDGSGIGVDKKYDPTGCSIIIGIFSFFAFFAAITCLKRRHIDVAIAGALLGIFSFGFFFIGSILSIIALIIIWFSRDEFENGKKGKIF